MEHSRENVLYSGEHTQLVTVDSVEDDQLAVLLGELDRIDAQAEKITNAVDKGTAIVVHPRREAYDTESEADTPLRSTATPMKVVASAGLVGFNVAQDLLSLDFSTPEEAPEEFKAMPFNSHKSMEVKPGLSGSFGMVDPLSRELQKFLLRLEEQKQEILVMARALQASGRTSGSRPGLSSSRRHGSGELPPLGRNPLSRGNSGGSLMKPPLPTSSGMPAQTARRSNLQPERSLEERKAEPAVPVPSGNEGLQAGASHSALAIPMALPPIRTRPQDEDAAAISAIEERRDKAPKGKFGAAKQAAPKAKAKPVPKRTEPVEEVVIPDKFVSAVRDGTGVSLPSDMSLRGCLLWLLYVMCFGFYMFCRGTTVSATANKASLFIYQIIFLLAECCFFLSGSAFGMAQMRKLREDKPAPQKQAAPLDPAATASVPSPPPVVMPQYNIQVLMFAGSRNAHRMEQAVVAAHALDIPEGCTRTIYLVDPYRDQAKSDIITKLSLEGLVYMPASSTERRPLGNLTKAATLNSVLKKLYPKDVEIKETELVMLLDDDQVVDKTFLAVMLPKLALPGVRIVTSPPGFDNVSATTDVFNQLEEHHYQTLVPGYEAFGYVACASTGFVVRADCLQEIGWLPSYSHDIGLALGLRFKRKRFLGKYHSQVLLRGLAPTTTAGVYIARSSAAKGRFEALFCPTPAIHGSFDMRYKLMYHSEAWCQILWAWLFPLFVLVPIIRVFFNYFPFVPNKWFGLGFVLFYMIATPLLYSGMEWRPSRLRSVWHWITANHNLGLTYFLDFWRAAFTDYAARKKPQKTDVADAKDAVDTVVNITASTGEGAEAKGPPKSVQPDRPAILGSFPFGAALGFAISLATVAVGCWLLFSTKGVLDTPRTPSLDINTLRSNLTLILSILWAATHTLIFSIPLYYSCVAVHSARSYDMHLRPANSARATVPFGLAAWSCGCFILSALFAITAVIACLGLGRGFQSIHIASDGYGNAAYASALASSVRFYTAQRSGPLLDSPVTWRGSSGLDDSPPGGYYVGTSNLKLTLPIAIAATQLAWAMIAAPQAFNAANASTQAATELKWAADYLIACQTGPAEYVAIVGNVTTELGMWARPEDMTWPRPTQKVTASQPGSDIIANAAAALAAVSLAYQPYDAAYAKLALVNARNLYAVARDNQGLSSTSLPQLAQVYKATGYMDDLLYAAAWLHKATQEDYYMADANQFYRLLRNGNSDSWQRPVANWDNQYWLALMLMWDATRDAAIRSQLDSFLHFQMKGGNGVAITPAGLSWTGQEGPLRNAANAALIAMLYGTELEDGDRQYEALQYRCWARSQLQYMLGSSGHSFVVGLGTNPPSRIPVPAASCPSSMQPCAAPIGTSLAFLSPGPNPHILRGALVSGPTVRDRFTDGRTYQDTVVSLEYNAAYTTALALVADRHDWMKCAERNGLFDELGAHLPAPAF